MKLLGRSITGLDIGAKEIRAIEISGSLNKSVIRNIAKISLPEGAVREGKITDPEKVGEVISELWKKNKMHSKDVMLGINNTDVIIRFALLPRIPKDKLAKMIRFQAPDYIPFPLEEVEFDYSIISETENEEGEFYNVLIVAARKDMLAGFLKAMNHARLNVYDIKSSALIMDKLLPEKNRNDMNVLVNLDSEICNILIMDNNKPAFARTVILGWNINNNGKLDINDGKVEEAKEYISKEIRSSIAYYQSQNINSAISKVYLTGCAVLRKEIADELIKSIGARVELLRPYDYLFGKFKEQNKFAHAKTDTGSDVAAEFAVALGLAFHGLKEG